MSREKANERINSRIAVPAGQKSHTGAVVLASVVVVCVLIGVIFYLMIGRESEEVESVSRNTVITPDNIEEVLSELDETSYTPSGSYEVIMSTEWTFPDGASASADAYVENSVNNRNTVFFTIALADDDETEIYSSPFLPVGSHIENIQLDTKLSAGVYGGVLTYHLVNDAEKELSSVSVSITITVEN